VSKRRRLSVYARVIRAADRGTGTYLTPEDCRCLEADDSFECIGRNDLLGEPYVDREGPDEENES